MRTFMFAPKSATQRPMRQINQGVFGWSSGLYLRAQLNAPINRQLEVAHAAIGVLLHEGKQPLAPCDGTPCIDAAKALNTCSREYT